MLPSEALDTPLVSGISLGFAMIFFVPLSLVAVIFLFYCGVARRSVIRMAKTLSILWIAACVPASLLILMGHAFNSNKTNPLLIIPLWVGAGLVALWLPVALRALFRIKPL
jgi:hypothetical protein